MENELNRLKSYCFNLKDLPIQSIVGKANLTDIKIYNNEEEFLQDSNKHLASEMKFGRYGFILENIKRIESIKYKGQLRLFEINLK